MDYHAEDQMEQLAQEKMEQLVQVKMKLHMNEEKMEQLAQEGKVVMDIDHQKKIWTVTLNQIADINHTLLLNIIYSIFKM